MVIRLRVDPDPCTAMCSGPRLDSTSYCVVSIRDPDGMMPLDPVPGSSAWKTDGWAVIAALSEIS